MIVRLCPHCGSLTGAQDEITRIKRELSKRLQNLLEALLQAGDEGISREDLAVKIYGPQIARTKAKSDTMQQDLRNLRRKIERYGYCIPAMRPYHAKYKIMEIAQ